MRPFTQIGVRASVSNRTVHHWISSSDSVFRAVVLASLVTLTAMLGASAANANDCAALKLAVSGNYVHDTLDCHAAVEGKRGKVSAACLRREERALEFAFAKAERRGNCTTKGDVATVERSLDTATFEVVKTLAGAGTNRCSQQKLHAAGDEARRLFFCNAKAVKQGVGFGVEPACVAKAQERLAAAFGRADTSAACADKGNAAVVERQIVTLVLGGRNALSPAVSSCSPVEVTVMHGANMLGNARLAKIENGMVPCMNVDDGTIATCHFSDAAASGKWIEGPAGSFALAGQAVTPSGAPGGNYVIATKVSDAASAACLDMPSMDTAGRLAFGQELVDRCVVEEATASWNQQLDGSYYESYFLRNYVPDGYEVCTADPVSYDGAELVRSYAQSGNPDDAPDTFCYTGYGAALNDINGHERDAETAYLTGPNSCHRIFSGGYEVPGAKRPATRSLPAPGVVNTRSRILWRPVNPNVFIATPPPK